MFKKSISLILSIVMALSAFTVFSAFGSAKVADLSEVGEDDYPYRGGAINAVDQWQFKTRQCTSFCAWRINDRLGIKFNNSYKDVYYWGNAGNWGNAARQAGITVDSVPAPGAVAWWSGGHVAWVSGVEGDDVFIEEYNYAYTNNYNSRTVNRYDPTGYIHFRCATHTWDNGVVTEEADCTHDGVKTYTCTVCGDTKTEAIKGGHKYTAKAVLKATLRTNGKLLKTCTVCGKQTTAVVYRPKTIALKQVKVAYNGKYQTPAATVTDIKGNIISDKLYTVTYAKNKNVGIASATVKFKGWYSGSKKLSFMIYPKGTDITKLSGGVKCFAVKWAKQNVQTTGYQIQYAMDSKFTKNKKTLTVSNTNTTAKKIASLKANATYYVRVRTYRRVSGQNYISVWSKVRSVKTTKPVPAWSKLYKDYVLNKKYLTADGGWGDEKSVHRWTEYSYLYDLDHNGMPELFVHFGSIAGSNPCNVYTVRNNKVVLVEKKTIFSGLPIFYDSTSKYNGLYSEGGRMGVYYVTYYYMKNGKIKSQPVVMDSVKNINNYGEGFNTTIKNKTLYNAFLKFTREGTYYSAPSMREPKDPYKNWLDQCSYDQIKSMGWNAFLQKYGY